jgi:hypothetical protein
MRREHIVTSITVKWVVVATREETVQIPDGYDAQQKQATANNVAKRLTETAGVVRGSVSWQADDGTFGGNIS